LLHQIQLKATESMPAFRLATPFFDLLAHSLRQAVAHSPAHPSHPLMHRLSSRRFGRNVWLDAPPEEGRQKGLAK